MPRLNSLLFVLLLCAVGCEKTYPQYQGVNLLEFHAVWCGPCVQQKPAVDRLQKNFSSVNFSVIDIDENPELAQEFSVESIPYIVIISDGKVVRRFVGLQSYSELATELAKYRDSNQAK